MADILLLIVVIIGIYLLWQILYDTGRFVIKEYEVTDAKVCKNCRIVLLADLHNKSFGKDNTVLEAAIHEQKPDMILIAGDMITAGTEKNVEKIAALLNRLSEKYPIYYASGNHEYRMEIYPQQYGTVVKEYARALNPEKIKWLKNEREILADYGICIYGSEIDKKYYKRMTTVEMEEDYMQSLLGQPAKELYNILLAHNPEYFPAYAAWGADLTLSGHVHGGMVRVPVWGKGVISPKVAFFPKYDGGLFVEGNARMILSRGLGTHTIPVRLFNPGELVVIDLKSKEER